MTAEQRSVHAQDITWPDYMQRLAEGAVVFLPVGSCEQHGPGMPLGTDVYIPQGICERLAKNIDGVVMPPFAYGYKSQVQSGGGQSFPGTTSLSGATLTGLTHDVMEELFRHGAKRICIFNGHGENSMFVTEGIDLALKHASKPLPRVVILRAHKFVRTETLDSVYRGRFKTWDQEHAGLYETALMMALQPQLVLADKLAPDKAERLPGYEVHPATDDMIAKSGVLSSPVGATAEMGEMFLSDIVRGALGVLRTEFALDEGPMKN